MTAVPSLMHLLLPALQVEGKDGQAPTDTLRLLILSGELLSIQLWKDLASAMPCTTILNLYGSTEVEFLTCPANTQFHRVCLHACSIVVAWILISGGACLVGDFQGLEMYVNLFGHQLSDACKSGWSALRGLHLL
jgi:non-ribosomal peptide synthetase component F